MALTSQSLFLYGISVDVTNNLIDFRAVSAGPVLTATLNIGNYTLSGLLREFKRAMEAADPAHLYSGSANRTTSGGTQNRITLSTNSAYLDLLFLSGIGNAATACFLFGFTKTDKTGNTTYTGSSTAGTPLVSELVGYNYLGPEFMRQVFGSVNVSSNGTKEALVWSIQQWISVEFKHEPMAKAISEWVLLIDWMIQQKEFEFTPEISNSGTLYEVTLDGSEMDSKGLGFKLPEMLPDFPFYFRTGNIKMRRKAT